MFVPLLEYCNLDCLPLALKERIFLDRLQIHGLKGEKNLSLSQCPAIDGPVGLEKAKDSVQLSSCQYCKCCHKQE